MTRCGMPARFPRIGSACWKETSPKRSFKGFWEKHGPGSYSVTNTSQWMGPRFPSRSRLGEVRQRMLAITYEITLLQNEARVFAVHFWRNFYRAMLTHSVRSAMTKRLVAVLAVILLAHRRAIT